MECDICKERKIKDRDVFKCDGCKLPICKSCGKLSASEIKVLQLSSRVMKFNCPKCVLEEETRELLREIIVDKDVIIEDKKEIIRLLNAEIENLKGGKIQQGAVLTGFSHAVKMNREEVLLVKPKNTQTSAITRQKIEEKICPSSLGIAVSKVKFAREGGVVVGCTDRKDIEKLCGTLKETLGQEYEVAVPTRRNPKIRVYNLGKKLLEEEDDLVEKLIVQNTITTEINKRVIKVVHKYEDKKGRMHGVISLDPETYRQIKLKGTLHIGWKTCRFDDYINIVQCFKCYRYGHMARDCDNDKNVCPKCTEDHSVGECQAQEFVCTNCKYASQVLKIPGVDFKHTAYDRSCKAYGRVLNQLRQKIDYPDIFDVKQ